MILKRRFRAALASVTAMGLAGLLVGCASGLEELPLPAPSISGGSYSLHAVFASALNLPARAKVKLNGADIGEVESIAAEDYTARVTMRIRSDAPIYQGATAELRSATPLGDLFVAIHPDPNQAPGAARLRDGYTVPLSSTSAAATVEELLGSMALLVNGGAIRQVVSVFNGAGAAVGGRGDKVRSLLDQSTALISRFNDRSAQLNQALHSTSALAADLTARQQTLDDALDVAAPAMNVISDNSTQLADLLASVARITGQVSRFPSLQGTDSRSTVADLNHLAGGFNEIASDPNLSINSFNRLIGIFMKTTSATSARANVDVRKLALGWLPDKNYPGDPGLHFPDGTDWHAMVGSLRYEWNLLLGRVMGPRR